MTTDGIAWEDGDSARLMIKQGDAIALMRDLPDESVDLIVTDPPYESLEKHRSTGTTTRLKHSTKSSNDWFKIFPNDRFGELFAECHRVMKKNSHLYIFCDDETSNFLWFNNHVRLDNKQKQFKYWKRIVWDKVAIGMGYHWRARYEFIVFFEKGKKKLHELGWPDIIQCKRVSPKNSYPGQKPVEVCRKLVTNSSVPGDVVLDPFCGSGSVGVAALKTGRRFIGFDLEPKAVEVTTKRLLKL